jgi:diguanylate cyclase (GGDEF)-like protein/PAS domain S-box-containing protein
MTSDIKNVLKEVDFLSHLPNLDDLEANCTNIKLLPDDFLFREDDIGDSMFVILSGVLKVFKKNRVISTRTTGEYLGEMALLGNGTRSASIQAISESTLLKISGEQFHQYLANNPASLMPILKTLSQRSKTDLEIIQEDNIRLINEKKLAKRLNKILDDTANEIFVFTNSGEKIKQVNSKACKSLGYSVDEIKSLKITDWLSGISTSEIEKLFNQVREAKKSLVSFEALHKRKDDTIYPVEIQIQCLEPEHPPVFLAIAQDISERIEVENRIKTMAFFDNLTGLPNRNLLNDRMEIMIAQSARRKKIVGFLYIDLDNFKTINENLGHSAGDELIKEVANRLKITLRKEDTLAHIGDDKFVILLTNLIDDSDAAKFCEKLFKAFEKVFFHSNQEILIGLSIGISLYPNDGKDFEVLFKNADIAMYRAKDKGGTNYQFFMPAMNDRIVDRINLEQTLRKALNEEELKLYYQPKVDLISGEISSLEALIRWKKPDGSLVLPDQFIPLAEESHLILLIGEWVLHKACQQIKIWEQEFGKSLRVSVNLSSKQIEQPNLVKSIKRIVKNAKIDEQFLELEITEPAIMKDVEGIIKKLNALNEQGIQSSIDDFGSGYFSLNDLKNLPVNALKIDQSFTQNSNDKKTENIIKAIIKIAKSLGLQTVAEGVETTEQKVRLKNAECDFYQGFLFSEALTTEEINKRFFN